MSDDNRCAVTPDEGLRTERVTLEVTHRKHTAHEWAWPQMIWLDEIRGESVRVVDDAAEITRLTAERDLARAVRDGLRSQRDAARARVAELEAAPAASGLTAEEREASTEAMKCMTKLRRERDEARAERDAAIRERDAAIRERDEAREERALLLQAIGLATTAVPNMEVTADDPIGMMRRVAARVAELERDRRPATWQEEEAAVELAWLLCGLEPYWPSDEPGTIVRHAESMRREVGRLRDRVAELEAAAAPAANASVEKQEPVAWGVLMTPGSKVWRCSSEKQAQKCVDHFGTGTVVPLYAAPRGWLTAEERGALKRAFDLLCDDDGDQPLAGTVQQLLARSTPPRVKVPTWIHEDVRRCVIAAIRAAGGEVEE